MGPIMTSGLSNHSDQKNILLFYLLVPFSKSNKAPSPPSDNPFSI